jgi:peptidoglycan-associated lipoprotein
MPRNLGCLLVFVLLLTISLLARNPAQDAPAPSTTQDQAAAPDQAGATEPIPDVPAPAVPVPTDTQRQDFHQSVQDIHFDFDRANIRPEDHSTLQSDAQWLQSHPNVFITIEGHADERGDIVYNLALSDIRAQATHNALMQMGVPEKQIVFATGWGKLYPVCAEADESCWAQNRRSHFTLWGEGNGVTSSGAASH